MSQNPSAEGPIRVRCKAHRKNGEQCKLSPIAGGSVCRVHGGAAQQVRNKAAQRIAEAADPAAAKLVHLIQSSEVPHHVQLAAAKDLLDRAGLKARETVLLETKKWEQVLEDVTFDISEWNEEENE